MHDIDNCAVNPTNKKTKSQIETKYRGQMLHVEINCVLIKFNLFIFFRFSIFPANLIRKTYK